MKELIEEFGQGIVDHINRNRGKYALGAGATGLLGTLAYNGNLQGAVNAGVDGLAGLAGAYNSNAGSQVDLGNGLEAVGNATKLAYNMPDGVQVPMAPVDAYQAAQMAGDTIDTGTQAINSGVQTVTQAVTPSATHPVNTIPQSVNSDDSNPLNESEAPIASYGGVSPMIQNVQYKLRSYGK